MIRAVLALILATTLAATAWPQDAESPTDADVEEEAPAASREEPEDEIDDVELDDTNYADVEEDDFRPSEDIPADQSIPFPTDI